MEEKFTEEMSDMTKEQAELNIQVETPTEPAKEKKPGIGSWILSFLPLVLAIVINLGLSMVLMAIVSAKLTLELVAMGKDVEFLASQEYLDMVMERVGAAAPTLQLVLEVVFLIIFGFWFYKLSKKQPAPAAKRVLTPTNIVLAIVVAVIAEFAVQFETSLYAPFFPGSLQKLSDSMNMIGAAEFSVLTVLTVAILAPIAEELIFRGVIMKLLQRTGANIWVCIILQGICFGIFHMNLVQGIYAAELGILLGYANYKCKNSIIPSTIMHFAINFSAVVLSSIGLDIEWNIFIYLILTIVLGAAAIFGCTKLKLKEETAVLE